MNAPRVTPEDLEAAISGVQYVLLPDERTTVCMLTLDNGFTVRGESSCVCRENYVPEAGHKFALEDAKRKLWPLLGFRLADRLAAAARGPRHRDAGSGEYVSPEYAALNPLTTVRET